MPTIEDVATIALALPGVREGTSYRHRAWSADGAKFAWERPFSKADVRRFGDAPVPGGPILAVAVEDLGDKAAVLATGGEPFLTIPHLDDYPVVLIRLDVVSRSALVEAIEDAWAAVAPAALVAEHRAR